jgi:type II secretory pathway pseudopilin PulG
MDTNWLYAIVVAVIIIVALSFYAAKLLRQLVNQKKAQQQAELARQQGLALHDHKVLSSVHIITRAMKEEQCDFSEGCWRLSVLLTSLKMSSDLDLQFPAIFELYNKIKHLSILDDRKELTKPIRMKQDYQRMTVEAQLHGKIVKDLDLLQQYTIERMSILKP